MRTPRAGATGLTAILLLTALLLPACGGRDGGSDPQPAAPAATVASVQDSVTRAQALLDGLDADFEGDDTDG